MIDPHQSSALRKMQFANKKRADFLARYQITVDRNASEGLPARPGRRHACSRTGMEFRNEMG
jgi:hypothetical protein